MKTIIYPVVFALASILFSQAQLIYQGGEGIGKGKHIVFWLLIMNTVVKKLAPL